MDEEIVFNHQYNKPPAEDEEREAFIQLNPPGFFIRHPPAPHKLDAFLTLDDDLFQTIHMGGAEVDATKWILVITGMVKHPFALTLSQLKGLPSTTLTSFNECYGSPLVPPTKALRRIGNVRWTGVPLHHLLDKAGVQPGARFVWSEGLDRGCFANIEADRYQKDLPMEKAMSPEVLIAYEMNGQPISRNRGGPVRLVVPGWFGTNSTKWLCKLSVQDRRAPGIFTTKFYNEKYPPDDPTCAYKPIWKVQPNSMVVKPAPEATLEGPDVVIEGWAWSADGVERVDVSADEGETWFASELEQRTEYSWQRYRARLKLGNGTQTVLAKATGHDGRAQPLGGGRNHVHRVTFQVVQ